MQRLLLRIILLVLLLSGCDRAERDVGTLTLDKPAGWAFISRNALTTQDDQVRVRASELDAALSAGTAAPLFALAQNSPPFVGFNPTFGLTVQRAADLRGRDALGLLGEHIARAREQAGDALEVVIGPRARLLAGLPAAEAELVSRLDPARNERLVLALVVSGDTSVMLAGSLQVDDTAGTAAAFDRVLASFTWRLPRQP